MLLNDALCKVERAVASGSRTLVDAWRGIVAAMPGLAVAVPFMQNHEKVEKSIAVLAEKI